MTQETMFSALDSLWDTITRHNVGAMQSAKQLNSVRQKHQKARHKVESAIDGFNRHRDELIYEAVLAAGLGVCDRWATPHLVAASALATYVYVKTDDEISRRPHHTVCTVALCHEDVQRFPKYSGFARAEATDPLIRTRHHIIEQGGTHGIELHDIAEFAHSLGFPGKIKEISGLPRGRYKQDGVKLPLID